jgi:hypothetical protein
METTAHSYFSIPPRNFGSASSRRSEAWSVHIAPADQAAVRRFLTAQDAARADLAGSGFSYRHDWGLLAGRCRLLLEWDAIAATSRVFLSLAERFEGGPDAEKHAGTANFRLFDVVPRAGGIGVRLHVEGDSPLRLVADYLVISA